MRIIIILRDWFFFVPLNSGIIDLMNQYGICLAAQNNKKW